MHAQIATARTRWSHKGKRNKDEDFSLSLKLGFLLFVTFLGYKSCDPPCTLFLYDFRLKENVIFIFTCSERSGDIILLRNDAIHVILFCTKIQLKTSQRAESRVMAHWARGQ